MYDDTVGTNVLKALATTLPVVSNWNTWSLSQCALIDLQLSNDEKKFRIDLLFQCRRYVSDVYQVVVWFVNTIVFCNIRCCHDIASLYVISILFRLYYVDGYHRLRFVWQIQSCGRFYYMLHSASSVCVCPKEKTSRLKYIVKCYVLR